MKRYLWCLAALLLFGCKTAQQDCIDLAKVNPEALCTMQFDPVCGCNGQTYSNACLAENAGVTAYTKGSCPE